MGGSFGYSGKDYEYFMSGKRGFEDIINEIQDNIDEAEELLDGNPGPDLLLLYEKLEIWESMQIVLEACIRYAKRFSRLSKILAENFETDVKRKEELMRIAATCERVPAKVPVTLQESFQYNFFVEVWARQEDGEVAWPSRPDYYHWPCYNKDVNIEKNITKEDAMDLVGEFMIRGNEVGNYLPNFASEGIQGISGTWVWTIGGVNQDGSDACNDLTIAFLKVARLVRVSNPTFGFRWHPKVSDEVMREVFECIRQGLGYPSIRNDPVLIANGMYWHGHPLKEMRTWVHQACMSPCPTTKHGTQPCRMATATLNCAKMVEYVLHSGYDYCINMQIGPETGDASKFTDFEQLFSAWIKQMEWAMSFATRIVNVGRKGSPKNYGRPFLSSISERSVEGGFDINESTGERGNAWVTFFTWVENVDSLAAVKKLVFDEKKYNIDELLAALKNNWDGLETMRLDFTNAPKWGNDDDYVDEIMVRCLREVARHSWEIKCPSGNPWPALPENVSGFIFQEWCMLCPMAGN